MVFLTFMIGALNLCLGYALAVNLGYGPLSPWDAWRGLPTTPPADDTSNRQAPRELSVLGAWKVALATEASGMGALENRLRESEEQSDCEAVRECAVELKELCEATLREQGEAAGRFEDRFGDSDELGTAGGELQEAICEQLAQLETTLSNLRQMDLESDLPATGRCLIEEIDRVLVASRRLWNSLDAAFSASAAMNLG